MISKGCNYHIVRVKGLGFEAPPLDSVLVVKDFLEVLPVDLVVIPPKWEIDFGIHLMLGTKPHINSSLSDGSGRVE